MITTAMSLLSFTLEPGHDKTYNKTCVTIKDSVQPVHPHCVTRLFG